MSFYDKHSGFSGYNPILARDRRSQNFHMHHLDTGRVVLCGCMLGIRIGKEEMDIWYNKRRLVHKLKRTDYDLKRRLRTMS
jgi:hypothetical protein